MAFSNPSLNIVLLGKTGNGKSSTGNSILNRRVFYSTMSMTSCTQDCQLESAMFEDFVLNVIDTPGLIDTGKTRQEILGKLFNVMSFCPEGFNAFIFVFNCQSRFTEEEFEAFNIVKKFYGEEFLKICIVLLTHGDCFDQMEPSMPIKEWLQLQTGKFRDMIEECENRVILFYNKTSPEYNEKRQMAVNQLVNMIRENKMLYTRDDFMKAVQERKKMAIEDNLPQLQTKFQIQISLLTAEVEKAEKNVHDLNDVSIKCLSSQADLLLREIEEDDESTDLLQEFKNSVLKIICWINDLETSRDQNARKLKKLRNYLHLLKNPPSRASIVLAGLTLAASVVGGVVATIGSVVLPISTPAVAAVSGTVIAANAANVAVKVHEIKNYKKKLQEMENEIDIS